MMRFLLVLWFALLSQPLLAQEHLQAVYQRENQRLDLLLEWSPGQARPALPPVLKFDPQATVEKPRPAKRVPALRTPRDFTSWIISYNKQIPMLEANLISRTIVRLSEREQVDPRLVVALVAAESAFRSDARSPVGAQGLGQLMPGTAALLGVRDSLEPVQNLDGTVRYLSQQLRRWGSPQLALASYNAGPGAVQRYGGIPPYRETQEYVSYVLKLHRQLKSLDSQRTVLSQNQRSESWPK